MVEIVWGRNNKLNICYVQELRDLFSFGEWQKPRFCTVGDHAVMVDLNSEEDLNCTLSTMTKSSQIYVDRMLIRVYSGACNFCVSEHPTCAIGRGCPRGNKCTQTWQPSSGSNCQTYRLILPLLCWSITSRQEIYNEDSYNLHQ